MLNSLKIISIVGCTALLVGCSPLAPVKNTPANYYMISDINPDPKPVTPTSLSLLVTMNSSLAGLDNTNMAYMQRPYQVEYFAENFWLQPPAKMLLPLTIASLQKTQRFKLVEAPPYLGKTDLHLKLTLLYLYEDFMSKPVTERMGVRATLVDVRTNEVLGTEVLHLIAATPSDNPYGGVQAANAATIKMLEGLSSFVITHSNKAL